MYCTCSIRRWQNELRPSNFCLDPTPQLAQLWLTELVEPKIMSVHPWNPFHSSQQNAGNKMLIGSCSFPPFVLHTFFEISLFSTIPSVGFPKIWLVNVNSALNLPLRWCLAPKSPNVLFVNAERRVGWLCISLGEWKIQWVILWLFTMDPCLVSPQKKQHGNVADSTLINLN